MKNLHSMGQKIIVETYGRPFKVWEKNMQFPWEIRTFKITPVYW